MGCVPTARQCIDYSREPFKTVALVSALWRKLKVGVEMRAGSLDP